MSRIVCANCGYPNSVTRAACKRCRTPLPHPLYATTPPLTAPGWGKAIGALSIGIAITVGTFVASPTGGFIVAWGAIGWGLWAVYRTWRARQAWASLRGQGYTHAQVEDLAVAQVVGEAEARDAKRIHDKPGDDYDSWKAKQA